MTFNAATLTQSATGHTERDPFRLVLEAGACENSIEWALHAAAEAARLGAWGFKVQWYHPDRLVHRQAPTYGDEQLNEPARQYDAFTGALSYGEWRPVKDLCDELGVVFFASVFDLEAVDAGENMGLPVYKIASADITHRPLIEAVRATGKPIILSTGAAHWFEVERALEWLDGADVTLLACNLHYPSPPDEANLARVQSLKGICRKVGYSDHTRETDTIVAARAAGACMVEKHFTITPELAAGDHAFAATPSSLTGWQNRSMTEQQVRGSPLWGSAAINPTTQEMTARMFARRGLYAVEPIERGTAFTWLNVGALRPSGWLEPWQHYDLAGREARRSYLPGDPISNTELV